MSLRNPYIENETNCNFNENDIFGLVTSLFLVIIFALIRFTPNTFNSATEVNVLRVNMQYPKINNLLNRFS